MLTILELLYWGSAIMFVVSLALPPGLASFGILARRRTVMLVWLLLFVAFFTAFKFIKNTTKPSINLENVNLAAGNSTNKFNPTNSSFYIARLNPKDNILEVANATKVEPERNKGSENGVTKESSASSSVNASGNAGNAGNASGNALGPNASGNVSGARENAVFASNATQKQSDKSLKDSAAETAKEMGAKIKETGREAKETGEELWGNLVEGASKFAKDAKDTGRELFDSAKNATK